MRIPALRIPPLAFLLALASGAGAQTPAEALVGAWTVDLRPAPEAAYYAVPFVVEAATDSTMEATFYGSPVREAVLNGAWGEVRFAFVTSDGGTTYHTTGILHDGWLEGTTHAIERGFLSYWTATRDAD